MKKKAQIISVAGAAGASKRIEQAKPDSTQNIPINELKNAICSGVFVKNRAEQGGIISNAEISKRPVVLSANAIKNAVMIINTADCLFTEIPSLRAMSGMTAVKICFFQFIRSRNEHATAVAAIKAKSETVTDRTSPNKYAVRSVRIPGI